MASSNGDFHNRHSHPANALPKPLLRQSKTPRPASPTQAAANTSNSHSSTKQTSTVIGSRISKHRKTAAGGPKREISNRSKTVGNAYNNNPTSNVTTQGVIVIHLNNRLGRRTAIQCSPQDTIHTLKLLASLKLGTRPEAMMLERQGQRALKDGLTLEDYEIGDGCSLDLEVDTED